MCFLIYQNCNKSENKITNCKHLIIGLFHYFATNFFFHTSYTYTVYNMGQWMNNNAKKKTHLSYLIMKNVIFSNTKATRSINVLHQIGCFHLWRYIFVIFIIWPNILFETEQLLCQIFNGLCATIQ